MRISWPTSGIGVAVLLTLALTSCAVPSEQGAFVPSSASPPPSASSPARIGLPRVYRGFVDALEEQGDWVLIEPFGWVFRPDVNTLTWRPYREGWWEPSDVYGWIWNSNDEFGWITDHYGSWFHDRFQGWVWQPGPVWGPAWVAWVATDDLIGWGPLAPEEYRGWDDIPGGAFLFARASQFDLANGGTLAMFARELPSSSGDLVPVGAEVVVEGKRLVLGPSLERVRQMGGMPRLRDTPEPRRMTLPTEAQAPALEARVRAALQAGKREWSARRSGGAVPPPPPPTSAPSVAPDTRRFKAGVAPLGAPMRTDSTRADSTSRERRIKSGASRGAGADSTRR